MVNAIILTFHLCAPTKLTNMTKDWTAHDELYYKVRAEEICIKSTKGILPCVKDFKKHRFQSYTWVCGREER